MKRIQSALKNESLVQNPRELNEISKGCAKDLQTETGQISNKGNYQLGLDEWPPTRILSLMLALSAWVGWVMHEKHGSSAEQPFSSRVCLQIVQKPLVMKCIYQSISRYHNRFNGSYYLLRSRIPIYRRHL